MPYLPALPCYYPTNACGTWTTSANISYGGANLPCTGIQTCDTVEVALQKIDELICQIIDRLPTTTTTTTTIIL